METDPRPRDLGPLQVDRGANVDKDVLPARALDYVVPADHLSVGRDVEAVLAAVDDMVPPQRGPGPVEDLDPVQGNVPDHVALDARIAAAVDRQAVLEAGNEVVPDGG